jgi:hypothetical protein
MTHRASDLARSLLRIEAPGPPRRCQACTTTSSALWRRASSAAQSTAASAPERPSMPTTIRCSGWRASPRTTTRGHVLLRDAPAGTQRRSQPAVSPDLVAPTTTRSASAAWRTRVSMCSSCSVPSAGPRTASYTMRNETALAAASACAHAIVGPAALDASTPTTSRSRAGVATVASPEDRPVTTLTMARRTHFA